MALRIAIELENGIIASYHRVKFKALPTGRTAQRVEIESWVDQAARQLRPNKPLCVQTLDSISKVKRPVQNPMPGQPSEIEVEEEFDFMEQPIPAEATTIKDACTKIAYQLVKANINNFKTAEDV